MAESGNSYQKIYEIVKQIPKGCGILRTGGGACRESQMGKSGWLRASREPGSRAYSLLPCGEPMSRLSDAFAFGGVNEQKLLLEAEGVEVTDGYVDMELYQWKKFRI